MMSNILESTNPAESMNANGVSPDTSISDRDIQIDLALARALYHAGEIPLTREQALDKENRIMTYWIHTFRHDVLEGANE